MPYAPGGFLYRVCAANAATAQLADGSERRLALVWFDGVYVPGRKGGALIRENLQRIKEHMLTAPEWLDSVIAFVVAAKVSPGEYTVYLNAEEGSALSACKSLTVELPPNGVRVATLFHCN